MTELVQEMYLIVAELERRFPGRRFTPDGHFVGSLGEIVARDRYGLTLLRSSTPVHDARSAAGQLVQVKLTQRRTVGLRSEPKQLLVLGMDASGEISEIYNGPGSNAWRCAGPMQKNGQRQIGVGKLMALNEQVPEEERTPKRSG